MAGNSGCEWLDCSEKAIRAAGAVAGPAVLGLANRNWSFVFVALNFPWLVLRARREETALAAEFGQEWADYAARVPFWRPRRPAPAQSGVDLPGGSG